MGASVIATNNWWGSNNSSPGSFVNPAVVTYSPWLVIAFSPSPQTVYTGTPSTLSASITTNNTNAGGFSAPDGTPVTFTGSLGALNPASRTLASGTASTTFTAGSTPGTATVSATIDNQPLSANITINLQPPPTLTSISPASGIQGTTLPVTLTGKNFVGAPTISVGNPGITISNPTVVSATQMTATFTIAASAAVGGANITVTNGGGTSAPIVFTVISSVPSITSLTPSSGTMGTVITVTGTGFTPTNNTIL